MSLICITLSACKEQHSVECTLATKKIYEITKNVTATPPEHARIYFDSNCTELTRVIATYGWNGINLEKNYERMNDPNLSPVLILLRTTPTNSSNSTLINPELTKPVKHKHLPIDLFFVENSKNTRSMQTISRMEIRGKYNNLTKKPYIVNCTFNDKSSNNAEEWELSDFGSSKCSGSIITQKGGHIFKSTIYVYRDSVKDLPAIYTKAEELLDSIYQETK